MIEYINKLFISKGYFFYNLFNRHKTFHQKQFLFYECLCKIIFILFLMLIFCICMCEELLNKSWNWKLKVFHIKNIWNYYQNTVSCIWFSFTCLYEPCFILEYFTNTWFRELNSNFSHKIYVIIFQKNFTTT